MWYVLLKFLHVSPAIVWIGGIVMVAVLHRLFMRSAEPALASGLLRYGEVLVRRVFGPAAGLALLTGIAAAVVGHLAFAMWMLWGLIAFFVAMIVGSSLMPRALAELDASLARGSEQASERLRRRLNRLQVLNLVTLGSVVWAMVFKPTW